MAKKFVRGITDIKTISNQDFDTNNVNDLLSDGQHNYIHRKKGNSEEYHNLTNNLKTIQSDDTDLLTVTNYNNTTNSATIRPKHDSQKEQLLESTDETIIIEHGKNATDETTSVDTNPQKVLEHSNLLTDYGISKATSGNTTKLGIEYTKVEDGFDLNALSSGFVRGVNLTNAPSNEFFFVESATEGNHTVQKATALSTPNTEYVRLKTNGTWGKWREQVGDKSQLSGGQTELVSPHHTITITEESDKTGLDVNLETVVDYFTKIFEVKVITGYNNVYTHDNATMKTQIKPLSDDKSKYCLFLNMHKGQTQANFYLSFEDINAFSYLMNEYGVNNKIDINGLVFTLNAENLSVTTDNATDNPFVTSFSTFIDNTSGGDTPVN